MMSSEVDVSIYQQSARNYAFACILTYERWRVLKVDSELPTKAEVGTPIPL